MKLDCVLSACNLNPIYIEFIPIFIKTWKKLYPDVDIRIVLIADEIPKEYIEYSEYIILFNPIEGVSTAFTSQYIRSLYPSLLNYENGIMITDIDMIPMNEKYYTENIKNFDNEKFIYYRDVLLNNREIAMCYNIATPKVWGEIFNIKNIDDIFETIKNVNKNIVYDNTHGGKGWSRDQLDLYTKVMNWNKITNNFVYLKDKETGYHRLCRDSLSFNSETVTKIKNHIYSDYHLKRPYNSFKNLNDEIFNLL